MIGVLDSYSGPIVFDFSDWSCEVTVDGSVVTGSFEDSSLCAHEVAGVTRYAPFRFGTEIRGAGPVLEENITENIMEGVYRGEVYCMVAGNTCVSGRVSFPDGTAVELNQITDGVNTKDLTGSYLGGSCIYEVPAGWDAVGTLISTMKCEVIRELPRVPSGNAINTCLTIDLYEGECHKDGKKYDTFDASNYECSDSNGVLTSVTIDDIT